MTKRFLIFMMPLCIMLFGCEYNKYGEFLFEFNDNEDGLIFLGCEDEERDRIFYVPETMYGQPVVEIGRPKSRRKIYAKTVVLPNSVTSIGNYSFLSDIYPTLKNIIIKGVVENLDKYAFFDENSSSNKHTSYTIVLLSTTVPPKVSSIYINSNWKYVGYQTLEFYVPDESVTIYKQADGWSRYANSIYPLSEYKDTL